jgi:hypothetical protein
MHGGDLDGQVFLDNIVRQLRDRPLGDHAASIENGEVVRQFLAKIEILFDEVWSSSSPVSRLSAVWISSLSTVPSCGPIPAHVGECLTDLLEGARVRMGTVALQGFDLLGESFQQLRFGMLAFFLELFED